MTEDKNRRDIKVTDHRHFGPTGERRQEKDAPEQEAARGAGSKPAGSSARAEPPRESPVQEPAEPRAGRIETEQEMPARGHANASAARGFSEMAAGLVSSFSLLIARLAQETEIYLGLVPYPGKSTPEPDLEAARAMIDMLSMLEEKTKGNLDPEESRLLADLIYTYRLEFVRRAPGGGIAP